MTAQDSPDHVRRNRAVWTRQAPAYVANAERSWATDEFSWGIWGVPESELRVLPNVAGQDVIELGCGTAYVCAWLARRGARVVGVDPTPVQLDTARRMQREHGLEFPLVEGYAERLPFEDESFDLAISEYGAAIWADPYGWIPEAARVLRPGGSLIFLGNGTILALCVPDVADEAATDRLLRPYFGMHRFEWPDDDSVEFHLGYGDWIRLFRANGLEVEDLIEVRPREDSTTGYPYVTVEWARKWPSEEIWKVRKRG